MLCSGTPLRVSFIGPAPTILNISSVIGGAVVSMTSGDLDSPPAGRRLSECREQRQSAIGANELLSTQN
jgi:hypothetical protein